MRLRWDGLVIGAIATAVVVSVSDGVILETFTEPFYRWNFDWPLIPIVLTTFIVLVQAVRIRRGSAIWLAICFVGARVGCLVSDLPWAALLVVIAPITVVVSLLDVRARNRDAWTA